jgi:hypothetical protein
MSSPFGGNLAHDVVPSHCIRVFGNVFNGTTKTATVSGYDVRGTTRGRWEGTTVAPPLSEQHSLIYKEDDRGQTSHASSNTPVHPNNRAHRCSSRAILHCIISLPTCLRARCSPLCLSLSHRPLPLPHLSLSREMLYPENTLSSSKATQFLLSNQSQTHLQSPPSISIPFKGSKALPASSPPPSSRICKHRTL